MSKPNSPGLQDFFLRLYKLQRSSSLLFGVFLISLVSVNLASLGNAFATTYFTKATVAPLNMNAAATSVPVAIDFTTASADGAGTITLVWSALTGGGSVASVAGLATSYNGTACNSASYFSGATLLPTSSPTAAGSGTTITLGGVNALAATTQYCAFVGTTTGMTNPSAGTYSVDMTDTGTSGDTSNVGIDYISNDQVAVNAVVPPQFTMAMSANTDTIGNLLIASAVYSAGVTATINTNASNGWLLWAEDSNAGLKSVTAGNHVIATVPTGSNFNFSTNTGAEHYGLAVSSITTGSANAFYAYGGGTTGGGLSSTVFNQIASETGASVSSDAVTIKEVADISALTPAAHDYIDTITLIGAGSF